MNLANHKNENPAGTGDFSGMKAWAAIRVKGNTNRREREKANIDRLAKAGVLSPKTAQFLVTTLGLDSV